MTQIYTFRITYRGCEEKIWRVAEVSSNNTLAQLGYTIKIPDKEESLSGVQYGLFIAHPLRGT